MMTTLIDTNILVYAHSNQDLNKQKIAASHLNQLRQNQTGFLTTQVLSEFYVVMRKLLLKTLKNEQESMRIARSLVENYHKIFHAFQITSEIVLEATKSVERNSFSFWECSVKIRIGF